MKKDKEYKDYTVNIFLDNQVVGSGTHRVTKDFLKLYRLSKQGRTERIRKKNKARLNREINEQMKRAFREWAKNEKKRVSEKMPPM